MTKESEPEQLCHQCGKSVPEYIGTHNEWMCAACHKYLKGYARDAMEFYGKPENRICGPEDFPALLALGARMAKSVEDAVLDKIFDPTWRDDHPDTD